MRFPRRAFALTALAAAPALQAQITPAKPMPATVHVRVDAHGDAGTIPARVFGSFIEPIDYSVNNGVMAEILINGSLEPELWNHAMLEPMYKEQPELIETSDESGIPLPWLRLDPRAGNHYDLHVGQAANSWQSLTLMGSPGELVGIMQRVYLPVPRALKYNVSFYARHVSGPTAVTVALRTAPSGTVPGDVLATSTIDAPSTGAWTKYTTTLTLKAGQVERLQPVHFAISVTGDERVELDQISLRPADAVDNLFDPEVLAMSASMHMTELRLGGNFSSYYHWQDGIGDPDKRRTMKNIAWGIPEYNNFGTDEFLAYCKHTNAIPQFNINEGSGSPAEAVDWLKYIRAKYQGPLILELGNELYGKWQIGAPTINEVAARTLAFRQALQPFAAPDVTFMATGSGPGANPWNAQLLTLPAGTYDLLTTHYIVGTDRVQLKPSTPEFLAAADYAIPYAVGAKFDAMADQMNAVPGYKGHTGFAVTEWLFNNKGPGERNFINVSPSSRNEGGAVMIAGAYNTFFRHNSEIKLVDMTGLMEFAGIWKRKEQVFASPAWYVFRMYAGAKDQTLLPVTTDTGTYNVESGVGGYASVKDVPYIDITATRSPDGKSLTLYCVNRSLTADQPTLMDLAGFTPAASAEVEQITSGNRLTMNDEVDPHRVLPKSSTLTITSQPLAVTLPHESVTVIHLHRQ